MKTLYFYALESLALVQIDLNWLEKTFKMCLLSLHGIHRKTELMSWGLLDLQKKQTNILWTSIQ
jgi:hypothetical protein